MEKERETLHTKIIIIISYLRISTGLCVNEIICKMEYIIFKSSWGEREGEEI